MILANTIIESAAAFVNVFNLSVFLSAFSCIQPFHVFSLFGLAICRHLMGCLPPQIRLYLDSCD
jgi:hypothetical protein